MNGLSLICNVSPRWLVSDEFAETINNMYSSKDFNATEYMSSARRSLATRERELRTEIAALSEPIVSGGKSYFSSSIENGAIFMRLEGEIVQRTSSYSSMSGRSSISSDLFCATLDRVIQEHQSGITEIKKIGLIWNCPGGDANPSFRMLEKIKEASKYVNVYSMSAGLFCSGAVLVGINALETFSTDYGKLGSVGAAVTLTNTTPADMADGIEYFAAYSGSKKQLLSRRDAEGKISQGAKEEAQRLADEMGSFFQDIVWAARPEISNDNRKKISEAGVYSPKEALTLGLIDGIKTENEFLTYVRNESGNKKERTNSKMELTDDQKNIIKLCTEKGLTHSSLSTLTSFSEVLKTNEITTPESLSEKLGKVDEISKLGVSAEEVKNLLSMKDDAKKELVDSGMKYYSAVSGEPEESEAYKKKKTKLEKLSLDDLKDEVSEMKGYYDNRNDGSEDRTTTNRTTPNDELVSATEYARRKK